MKTMDNIGLKEVQAVYSGPEGQLWELIMGEQIHIGGFASSMDLAEKANIDSGMKGVDLCCCNGAGMRFLVRFQNVAQMHGVDATGTVIEQGRRLQRIAARLDEVALATVGEDGAVLGEQPIGTRTHVDEDHLHAADARRFQGLSP